MEKSEISAIFKECKDWMKPSGLRHEDDQVPQLSWVLFLKCLDDFERKKEMQKGYRAIITRPHRWRDWVGKAGGITGQDLVNFIMTDLFPNLQNLSIERGLEERGIVNAIFRNINIKVQDGYKLREIIDNVNKIDFTDTNTLANAALAYEDEIVAMKNAAENRAVFYTPKAIVQFIVNVIKPDFRKGERVFDPACGMGGFLLESLNQMKKYEKSGSDVQTLRYNTLYGVEKEGEYYLCAVLNMLLHDIDKPNLLKGNSLSINIKELSKKNQFQVIMTNPTYGGDEDKSVKDNLPYSMKGAGTELHFLYLVMESLRENGRCAIIMPNGVLFNTDSSGQEVKKKLFTTCNLHTIIRLPQTMFAPYNNIATNILFFEKGKPTKEIWYYEMPIREGLKAYGKQKPPLLSDFEPILEWMKKPIKNEHAWQIKASEIKDYNLDIHNPNVIDEKTDYSPHELIKQIISDEKKTLDLLEDVKDLIDKEIPQ
jgi:type I restriction enzyme M protein